MIYVIILLSKGGEESDSTGLDFPRLRVGTELAGLILEATNCRQLVLAKQADENEPNSGPITRYFFNAYLDVLHLNVPLYNRALFCYTIDTPRGSRKESNEHE